MRISDWSSDVCSSDLGALDGRLIALDAKTGREVWSEQTTDPAKPYSITGAPRVVKGKVIIGNGGAEYGVRGFFSAYDAETGKMAWRFYTVPGDPAKPYEHPRSEEHTSELQSLMRISYAAFCLKKKIHV